MTLEIARKLLNLPKEWENRDFQFIQFQELIYVLHKDVKPVCIDPQGKVRPVLFIDEEKENGIRK